MLERRIRLVRQKATEQRYLETRLGKTGKKEKTGGAKVNSAPSGIPQSCGAMARRTTAKLL